MVDFSIFILARKVESESSPFFAMFSKINNPRELAAFFGIKYRYFVYYLNAIPEENKYRQFFIKKKSGGLRSIVAPDEQLLLWQRQLAASLLHHFTPRDCVHGFALQKSILTNAAVHSTNRFIFNIDIKDFFPSIHFGRVRGVFRAKPCNANLIVATYLAKICCFQGKLPQGAATSPIISNLVCRRLDTQLLKIAKKYFLFYTRYADDITFSKRSNIFPLEIGSLNHENKSLIGNELELAIQSNDFQINPDKVHLQKNSHRQIVTGLIVNEKVNVQRRFVRRLRAMINDVEINGVEKAQRKHSLCRLDSKSPEILTVIRGKIEFLRAIKGPDDAVYKNYSIRLAKIDKIYHKILIKRNMEAKMRDFFISHASEDKPTIARPLADELVKIGFKVWYDEYELKVGDSLRQKVDEGLANSKYGIVILSQYFFAKKWPQSELNGLWAKEIVGDRVILPIWYNITQTEIVKFSPMIADKLAILTDGTNIPNVASQLAKSI